MFLVVNINGESAKLKLINSTTGSEPNLFDMVGFILVVMVVITKKPTLFLKSHSKSVDISIEKRF